MCCMHRRDRIEHEPDIAGEQIGHRRRRALVRHMRDVDAREALEQFHREVVGCAVAGRPIVELARLGLRQRDELAHRRRRHRRMGDQQVGPDHKLADRREVAQRVVGHVAPQVRQHRQRTGAGDVQRVAVGHRVRGEFGRDQAAGAAAVVDDELLAELRGHAGRENARDHVRRAAGRRRENDADRLVRVGLRGGRTGHQRERDNDGNTAANVHACSLRIDEAVMVAQFPRTARAFATACRIGYAWRLFKEDAHDDK